MQRAQRKKLSRIKDKTEYIICLPPSINNIYLVLVMIKIIFFSNEANRYVLNADVGLLFKADMYMGLL